MAIMQERIFKNEPSKICERQPLKNFQMVKPAIDRP